MTWKYKPLLRKQTTNHYSKTFSLKQSVKKQNKQKKSHKAQNPVNKIHIPLSKNNISEAKIINTLTRTSDTFLDLNDETIIIKYHSLRKRKHTIFVTSHCNYFL